MGFQESIAYPIDSQLLLDRGTQLPPQVYQQLIDEYVVVFGVLFRALVGLREKQSSSGHATYVGIEEEVRDYVFAKTEGMLLYVWIVAPRKFVFSMLPNGPQLRLCDIEGLPTFH